MGNEDRIALLIAKFIKKELTEKEWAELEDWKATNKELFERLTNTGYLSDKLDSFSQIDVTANWEKIVQRKFPGMQLSETVKPTRSLYKWFAWAALLIVFPGAVIFCCLHFDKGKDKVASTTFAAGTYQNDIKPGTSKATITLQDGSVIHVDENPIGVVKRQENYVILKENAGLVSYTPRSFAESIDREENTTITTPAGGNFQVKLPDGSNVWLNDNSSVTFNPAFAGTVRKVTITGQVYFEVAHLGNTMPFIVSIASSGGALLGQVQVLGTHFAISAYDDEPQVKTTLLKGSVQIKPAIPESEWARLQPGQQAQIKNATLSVIDDVNMEEAVAWKEGYFLFDHLTIKQVMQQVARWYNAEVVYESGASKSLVAAIPKDVPVSQVLKVLELTGDVHFRIEGKRIIVTN